MFSRQGQIQYLNSKYVDRQLKFLLKQCSSDIWSTKMLEKLVFELEVIIKERNATN